MELVLVGLCACTATDVVSILRKKRQPFTRRGSARRSRTGASSLPPSTKPSSSIYTVGGQVSKKAVEDAVRLSEEKYCSVSAMLQKTAKITTVIEYS